MESGRYRQTEALFARALRVVPGGIYGRHRACLFAAACAARGVHLRPHHNWFLSAALTDADLARVLDVTDLAFAEVARRAA